MQRIEFFIYIRKEKIIEKNIKKGVDTFRLLL